MGASIAPTPDPVASPAGARESDPCTDSNDCCEGLEYGNNGVLNLCAISSATKPPSDIECASLGSTCDVDADCCSPYNCATIGSLKGTIVGFCKVVQKALHCFSIFICHVDTHLECGCPSGTHIWEVNMGGGYPRWNVISQMSVYTPDDYLKRIHIPEDYLKWI